VRKFVRREPSTSRSATPVPGWPPRPGRRLALILSTGSRPFMPNGSWSPTHAMLARVDVCPGGPRLGPERLVAGGVNDRVRSPNRILRSYRLMSWSRTAATVSACVSPVLVLVTRTLGPAPARRGAWPFRRPAAPWCCGKTQPGQLGRLHTHLSDKAGAGFVGGVKAGSKALGLPAVAPDSTGRRSPIRRRSVVS
jgi:hypothetical protein